MHGYNGSATAIELYFEGIFHNRAYSPSNDDYHTSITAVQIFVQLYSVHNILFVQTKSLFRE